MGRWLLPSQILKACELIGVDKKIASKIIYTAHRDYRAKREVVHEWKCNVCGYEWSSIAFNLKREKPNRCPQCQSAHWAEDAPFTIPRQLKSFILGTDDKIVFLIGKPSNRELLIKAVNDLQVQFKKLNLDIKVIAMINSVFSIKTMSYKNLVVLKSEIEEILKGYKHG